MTLPATCAVFRILLAAVDAMPKPLVAKIASLTTPELWETQVVFQYFADHSGDAADIASDEAALIEDAARDIVSRETNEGQLSWGNEPARSVLVAIHSS